MAIIGFLFGLLTMVTHFIVVTIEFIEKELPFISWLTFIPKAILMLLRVGLAYITDYFHPEGKMRAKILQLTTGISEEIAENLTSKKEENDEYIKYQDEPFDESMLSTAIQRSMMENNGWVYLHTNLEKTRDWLISNRWDYMGNGVYLYPQQLENGTYKMLELGYDDNNFPVLRAEMIDTYSSHKQ